MSNKFLYAAIMLLLMVLSARAMETDQSLLLTQIAEKIDAMRKVASDFGAEKDPRRRKELGKNGDFIIQNISDIMTGATKQKSDSIENCINCILNFASELDKGGAEALQRGLDNLSNTLTAIKESK